MRKQENKSLQKEDLENVSKKKVKMQERGQNW